MTAQCCALVKRRVFPAGGWVNTGGRQSESKKGLQVRLVLTNVGNSGFSDTESIAGDELHFQAY